MQIKDIEIYNFKKKSEGINKRQSENKIRLSKWNLSIVGEAGYLHTDKEPSINIRHCFS